MCTRVCMCLCVHVRACVYVYTCVRVLCMFMCTCVCVCLCAHVCVCFQLFLCHALRLLIDGLFHYSTVHPANDNTPGQASVISPPSHPQGQTCKYPPWTSFYFVPHPQTPRTSFCYTWKPPGQAFNEHPLGHIPNTPLENVMFQNTPLGHHLLSSLGGVRLNNGIAQCSFIKFSQ